MPNKSPPRGLRTAGITAAAVAAIVVTAGVIGRTHDGAVAQQWSDAHAIPVVHLVAVTAAAGSNHLALPGTMQAFNSAKIYARISGYMRAWYRDIGARVGAGTPLGTLDTPDLDQQIIAARADLASSRAHQQLAATTARRWDALLTTTSVSKQEADEKDGDLLVKTAAVKAAEANLGRLTAMKAFATLAAPFSGIVVARNADIGDLITAGSAEQPLFVVADVRRIRIYVNVPQNYSAAIAPGLSARITVPDYPGREFPATVIASSGAINAQSGALLVQLIANNPGGVLKPGGYADVRFDLPARAGVAEVAATALLFRKEGMQVALVGPDSRVQLRSIAIGRDLGSTVEVLGGLRPGERVIDNPSDSLAAGALVRVANGPHA